MNMSPQVVLFSLFNFTNKLEHIFYFAPGRRQAIIWANPGILLIAPLGINFNEIFIEFNIFSFKKMHLKMHMRNGVYFVKKAYTIYSSSILHP